MGKVLTVSLFGKGDYTDIQSAIDNAGDEGAVIYIKEGVYRQRLLVDKPGIRLVGQGRVIIVYGIGAIHKDFYGRPYGTFRSETVRITGRDFTAENIIFVNDAGPGNFAGQAVAVYISADRTRFYKCRFLANQDTIYTGNPEEAGFLCRGGLEHRQYFEDCYIEGDVDFIFGNGTVVFYRCEIHSLDRHEPEGGNNGYITAASTRPETKYGYVFLECRITGSGQPDTVYLGRPWRDYARTVIMNSYIGSHIHEEGTTGAIRSGRSHPDTASGAAVEPAATGQGGFPGRRRCRKRKDPTILRRRYSEERINGNLNLRTVVCKR